ITLSVAIPAITMSKGTRGPVPYADVQVGHWYQARFEFKDDRTIDTPVTNTTPEQSTTAARPTPRNKSHRVLVLRKIPTPDGPVDGKVTCIFLTSFGGDLDWSTRKVDCVDRLKYIAVNTTAAPMSPYVRIPITVRALYGFVKFTDPYDLPIGVGGGDKAIVHMREAGKGKTSISSPSWVRDYIGRLRIAWVTWQHTDPAVEETWPETQARWLESAKAIAGEFGRATVAVAVAEEVVAELNGSTGRKDGIKRFREDKDNDEDWKGKAPAKRRHSGPRWFDGADGDDDDDGVDSRMWSAVDKYAPVDEWQKFNDSAIQDTGADDVGGAKAGVVEVLPESISVNAVAVQSGQHYKAFPVLVKVELYELDDEEGEGIKEDVNFSLLDVLFSLPPMW
ncbi:hypothetical protein Q9L58_010342, partial [Maublancomyces gigas]